MVGVGILVAFCLPAFHGKTLTFIANGMVTVYLLLTSRHLVMKQTYTGGGELVGLGVDRADFADAVVLFTADVRQISLIQAHGQPL